MGNVGLLLNIAFLFPQRGLLKLSAANLLLPEQLLALLRHISQHTSTSHMTCGNLAICLGPNLLSPLQEKQLELQAMLVKNDKVMVSSAASCSLAGQRHLGCPEVPVPCLAAPCLQPRWLWEPPVRVAPQPALPFCAEAGLSSAGKGCLTSSQAPG